MDAGRSHRVSARGRGGHRVFGVEDEDGGCAMDGAVAGGRHSGGVG
jgi:hypothetical protein